MTTLYLSGPMTGLKEFNFPAFHEAAHRLRSLGFRVENPAENFGGDVSRPWAEYLREDLRQISRCDAIVTLDGYSRSKGATLEMLIARALGMPHLRYRSGHLTAPRVVGLIGLAGAGKDTFAAGLGDSIQPMSFADPLRAIARGLNPIVGLTRDVIVRYHDAVGAMGYDKAKRTMPEVRGMLQRLGTEAMRDQLGEAVWTDAFLRRFDAQIDKDPHTPVVVTDVRFDNEAALITKTLHGATVLVTSSVAFEAASKREPHRSEELARGCSPHFQVFNEGTRLELAIEAGAVLSDVIAGRYEGAIDATTALPNTATRTPDHAFA